MKSSRFTDEEEKEKEGLAFVESLLLQLKRLSKRELTVTTTHASLPSESTSTVQDAPVVKDLE